MQQDYPKFKVIGLLSIGLISFGFAPILVRIAGSTSPLILAAFRTGFAVILLLPYWLKKRNKSSQNISELRLEGITALAGVSLGLHFTFWIASLSYTSVASASVLVTIHPIMLIVVERLLFKRKFGLSVWIGVFTTFGGSVILGVTDQQVAQTFSDPLWGNFLAFSAAAIFVVYILIGQKVRQQTEWIDYVFRVYFFAAITCIALTLLLGIDLLDIGTTGILAGLGLAFGPQVLGHGSMNYAVKYISPTLLSTLVLTEPLIASVLAFFMFQELPPLPSILAMIIILVGVSLTWKRKARKRAR